MAGIKKRNNILVTKAICNYSKREVALVSHNYYLIISKQIIRFHTYANFDNIILTI